MNGIALLTAMVFAPFLYADTTVQKVEFQLENRSESNFSREFLCASKLIDSGFAKYIGHKYKVFLAISSKRDGQDGVYFLHPKGAQFRSQSRLSKGAVILDPSSDKVYKMRKTENGYSQKGQFPQKSRQFHNDYKSQKALINEFKGSISYFDKINDIPYLRRLRRKNKSKVKKALKDIYCECKNLHQLESVLERVYKSPGMEEFIKPNDLQCGDLVS